MSGIMLPADHIVPIFPTNSTEPVDYSQFFPWKICNVHFSLRSVNEASYEPLLLSVGPYHHRKKERYEDIEKCKDRHLQSLISRRNQKFVNITYKHLKQEMRSMEKEIREGYASSFSAVGSNKFSSMIVLDGCFVIEILRRLNLHYQKDDSDPIFRIPSIMVQFYRDLFLLENQVPLFVLEKLFELTKEPEDERNFVQFAVQQLHGAVECFDLDFGSLGRCPHLLGLSHMMIIMKTIPDMTSDNNYNDNCGNFEFIKNAAELRKAGVVFKMNDSGFGAIKFNDNGVLEIPYVRIDDHTESLMRNYIAYEQYSEHGNLHLFTDFAISMDCLIDTAKDVELLRHAGILSNSLGDDQNLAEMFNRLSLFVNYDVRNFYYSQQFHKANQYHAKRRHVWMANLRRNYFNSPWSLLSFLAALTLLVLTFIQTILSLLSYVSPSS